MNAAATLSFTSKQSFQLESGVKLPELTVAYHTYGTLNPEKSNVIWVCHALTANSDVADWWPGMVGENCPIDPEKHFIVCANILGSCYGTTGPLTINPETNQPWFSTFPRITIRDMVKAHTLLRDHLQIQQIELLIGGSMGGYQALEWCMLEPDRIDQLFLLATSASESAWGICIHTAQRMAIEADSTWQDLSASAGAQGLKAARGIGMLTYRNYELLMAKQTDPDQDKADNFRAESYIRYQGEKLANRFNAYSYWLLTKAMDSHNIARNRSGNLAEILGTIRQKTLVIGIDSDILCPVKEQQFISGHIPKATYAEISSGYGHDGFLIECGKISEKLLAWLDQNA